MAIGHSTVALNFTVVLLKNRHSVMGEVDAANALADEKVADKRVVTYVILAVVTVFGVVAPLSMGVWLGLRFMRLAKGMDKMAQLEFDNLSHPNTIFRELNRFQNSYQQMERGLQAFGRC